MAEPKLNLHAQMIRRLRERDREAQFAVYQQYSKAMFNTALRFMKDRAEAEDVLQEAFLSAFTKIDRYKEEATFGAWLKRIVINKSINALQKKKATLVPMEEAPLDALADSKPEDHAPVWNIDQINQAIQQLPDGYRVVFSLYLLEGYTHDEIGHILGISAGGSKSQYNRAKKKLRDILNHQSNV